MARRVKAQERSGEFRGQGKWSGPGESRLRNGQECLGAGEVVRARRVKAQERSGESRGKGSRESGDVRRRRASGEVRG